MVGGGSQAGTKFKKCPLGYGGGCSSPKAAIYIYIYIYICKFCVFNLLALLVGGFTAGPYGARGPLPCMTSHRDT